MVSQHTANVPSVHARLGSIPRLSAKLVSKKVRLYANKWGISRNQTDYPHSTLTRNL